jgi:hypothetical protein
VSYAAIIEDLAASRELGRIVPFRSCQHSHQTKQAAERCSRRLWHQVFGDRYSNFYRTSSQYRPRAVLTTQQSTDASKLEDKMLGVNSFDWKL